MKARRTDILESTISTIELTLTKLIELQINKKADVIISI
jgi:hypothetical protein